MLGVKVGGRWVWKKVGKEVGGGCLIQEGRGQISEEVGGRGAPGPEPSRVGTERMWGSDSISGSVHMGILPMAMRMCVCGSAACLLASL